MTSTALTRNRYYRLGIAVATGVATFANQAFGTHLTPIAVAGVAATGITLLLTETHLAHAATLAQQGGGMVEAWVKVGERVLSALEGQKQAAPSPPPTTHGGTG